MEHQKIILIVFFSLFMQLFTFAQCDKVGEVTTSNLEGCALLIRLANGDLIEPINPDNYSLEIGQTIQFDFESSIGNLACSGNQAIQLTCVEDHPSTTDPNCTADFLWFLSPNANPVMVFDPVAEATGTYTFAWDFGDGNVSTEEMPTHQYSTSGIYEVCLTVTDGGDCLMSACESIAYTTNANTQTCNFGLDLAVSGLTLNASIFSQVDFGPYVPQEIAWFNHHTGELLSEAAEFTHTFSHSSEAEIITAIFIVNYEDGTTCEGTICEPIVLEDNVVNCEASFDYEVQEDYTVQFINTSTGDFTDAEWEVDEIVGEGNVFSHAIDGPDYYEVCLTIHNDTGCEAVYCETVFLGTTADLCDIEDCVYPGDANQDGLSNYLDVLQIGLGYGRSGPAREESYSETFWSPMPAEEWGMNTQNGTDYKHLDCNGDGVINEADIEVISQNYMPIFAETSSNTEGHPNVWLEFLEESIIIDEDSPEEIEVYARVMVGTNDAPILDLYGVAFQVTYSGEFVVPYSAEIIYQNDAFLGTEAEVMGLSKDLGSLGLGKIEAAFSRKNHIGINGAGNVAIVKFIVEGDIIGGRSEPAYDFDLQIGKVKMIDDQGLKIDANVSSEPVTIRIINHLQNNTNNPEQKEKVQIYPNPVTDVLTIKLEYLEGEKVEVYNAMGQLVQTQLLTDIKTELRVDELPSGVYWVKVYTDKGAASERVFVE